MLWKVFQTIASYYVDHALRLTTFSFTGKRWPSTLLATRTEYEDVGLGLVAKTDTVAPTQHNRNVA